MLWQRSRQSGSLVADTCARADWVRSTAAKYSSGATLPRYAECLSAPLTYSTPVGDSLARGSGRNVKGTTPRSCTRVRRSPGGTVLLAPTKSIRQFTATATRDSLLSMEADQQGTDGAPKDFLAGGDEAVVKRTQDREQTDDELLMFRALWLLGSGLDQLPTNNWASTFPNDLAGSVCLVRAYRQLRAAVQLTVTGYYSEVGVLLRASYESPGAGRMLAKDPEMSSRWLLKQEWFPEKQVRQRITGRIVDEGHGHR
jgi:hypothetical protein